MATYTAGTAGDYAEIVIDYTKKSIEFTNPQDDNKPFKENRFGLHLNFLSIVVLGLEAILLSWLHVPYLRWILGGTFALHWLVCITYSPYVKYLEKLNQKITADYLQEKKLMMVEKVESTTWNLPYEFHNNKLDYKLYGEFARYIQKIHIKPKDYYLKSGGKIKKQIKDWDAFFYFSEIPKEGKMEIEWV